MALSFTAALLGREESCVGLREPDSQRSERPVFDRPFATFLYFSPRHESPFEGHLMLKRSLMLFAVAACSVISFAQAPVHQPKITAQSSGTTQLLIAVSPVNSRVVWAAGTGGTFVVTTDGGNTWRSGVVPGAETLQFRDVQGVSENVAYLLSIGDNTTDFRIYKTADGGATWHIQFTNETTNAFYDCFAFWQPNRGIAHSDSVDGLFPELRTQSGKKWWSIESKMPPALPGEASFSSSGTCVTTQGEENAWITTGGSTTSRILATTDGGDTWNAYDTPLISSPSGGRIVSGFPRCDARHRRRRRFERKLSDPGCDFE